MRIAVEGCAHGELEKIYDTLKDLESRANCVIDLLICCGDFQATRNNEDLSSMAVPKKYQNICTFYKYYSGEKIAPVLTVFVGGNHEASNHLQELPYGGWVAPNIYYLGYAGVINIGGIRIAGISGIYKGQDYLKGHFECPPYSENSRRSVYHVRNLEVFRLKQMRNPIDIIISHDWPRGISRFGDEQKLLNMKEYFRDEIDANTLGSKANEELLFVLKPSYWFAAHLHCKFVAIVPHKEGDIVKKTTKFLALDKCLPKRKFLQVIEIPHDASKPLDLHYDLEWLTILFLTNHLLNVKHTATYMPGPGSNERWNFSPTSDEMKHVLSRMDSNLKIPLNFIRNVVPYSETDSDHLNDEMLSKNNRYAVQLNPQTREFCEKLYIDDPIVLLNKLQPNLNISLNSSNTSLPSFSTPERKESSFIDDSDTSISSSLQSSQNNDSFELTTPSKVNRLSLTLPPPIYMTTDNSTDDETLEKSFETRTSTNSASESDKKQETNNEGETLDEIQKTTPPKIKKFKRRNEALYTSIDEDF